MTETPIKPRRKLLFGCIAVPIVGLALLFLGPSACIYVYKQNTKAEFRAHRAYYEGLVRQIQADNIPVDRMAFYILPENRYAGGTMLKVEPDSHERWFYALFDGTTVRIKHWNGVLRIYFGMRVKGFPGFPPSQYGVMYCAGDTAEPGAEESLEKF